MRDKGSNASNRKEKHKEHIYMRYFSPDFILERDKACSPFPIRDCKKVNKSTHLFTKSSFVPTQRQLPAFHLCHQLQQVL